MTAATFLAIIVAAWQWLWPIASFIGTVAVTIWGFFKAWPSLRRAFQVGDTVAALPEQLNLIHEQLKVVDEKADQRTSQLDGIEADLRGVKENLQKHLDENVIAVEEYNEWRDKQNKIYEELNHNGGLSIKDSISRLELKVNGFDQLAGETLKEAVVRMHDQLFLDTGGIPLTDPPA